jgi:hypothetical protein
MRVLLATVISVYVSGCAHWFGPAHGVFYAVGSTPDDTACQLSLAPHGSTSARNQWTVTGNFKQSMMVSYSPTGHVISLICDQTVVAARKFKYGRDVGIHGQLRVDESVH